jgi:hypothetical protein
MRAFQSRQCDKSKMKAKLNCWTCKGKTCLSLRIWDFCSSPIERKVGCDRTLPGCQNCQRSNWQCQGYSLKLAWPDKYDGRRKQKKYHAVAGGSTARYITQDGTFAFLNTTYDDLSGSKVQFLDLANKEDDAEGLSIAPTLSPVHGIDSKENLLLTYCELMRMYIADHCTNKY